MYQKVVKTVCCCGYDTRVRGQASQAEFVHVPIDPVAHW